MRSLCAFIPCMILIVSCHPQLDPTIQENLEDVRSVKTTFISHQSDTKDKNDKTVAVANYNPDGTLLNATQYMTYPYTQMEKADISIWGEPRKDMFLHLMDGLSLGEAENNFIYGNDWPGYYAEMVDKAGHPKFPKRLDLYSDFTTTINYESNMPNHIKTESGLNSETNWHISGHEEKFEYNEGKVVFYDRRNILSEGMLQVIREQEEKRQEKNNTSNSSKIIINHLPKEAPFKRVSYLYDGNNLVEVKEANREYKFIYKGDVLIRSEYFVNKVLRNHRVYLYKDSGLKEKTVIYNTHNELEYTILYKYEYYGAN